MREYELYLVIDADSGDEGTAAVNDRVTQLIQAGHGAEAGEVIKVDTRGRRRLAFPVNRKLDAQDFVFTFQAPTLALAEIERALKLDDRVLRYLLIRTGEE